MPDLPMPLVAAFARLRKRPRLATAAGARAFLAAPKPASPPPAALRARHAVSTVDVGGFPVHTVAPASPVGASAFFLHGGSFVSPMAPQHWAFVGQLADAGVRVVVPDYGLAPDHDALEATAFVDAAWAAHAATADVMRTSILGDSAGGALALALAQRLVQAGATLPGAVELVAPLLNSTLSNPAIPAVERTDPWLARPGILEVITPAWAGGLDPADPRLSPIGGPLAGLPPVRLTVGERDLLRPDVELLHARLREAGVPCSLEVAPGAVHDYPFTPTRAGRRARASILDAVVATGA